MYSVTSLFHRKKNKDDPKDVWYATLQGTPGVVKTHTSEMVHAGAERREVKWCLPPPPGEVKA